MGREDFNGTDVAKNIFNCIFVLRQRFGINYIVSVLVGSKAKRVLQYNHQELSVYGVLRDYSMEQIKTWLIELLEQGYLYQTKGQYPMIYLLEKAKLVLAGSEEVNLPQPNPIFIRVSITKGETVTQTLTLFKEGKTVFEIAKERGLAQETIIRHLIEAYQQGSMATFGENQVFESLAS